MLLSCGTERVCRPAAGGPAAAGPAPKGPRAAARRPSKRELQHSQLERRVATSCPRFVRWQRRLRCRATTLLVLLALAGWFGTGGLLWSIALRSDSDILLLVGEAFHGEENMASPDEPEVAPVLPGSAEWSWAQTIWDYHHLHHELEKADGIMVLCSHDLRVADEATRLYKAGLGDWVLFSGGFGTGPHSGANLNGWTRPEAEIFADAGVLHGLL